MSPSTRQSFIASGLFATIGLLTHSLHSFCSFCLGLSLGIATTSITYIINKETIA